MTVAAWKRSVSKTEYLKLIYELNIRAGEIVMDKPKKYRMNYADAIIKNCIEAMKFAQTANSIYMTNKTPERDYQLRRECLQRTRGIIENISTISDIFLERVRRLDREDAAKIYKQKKYIADICSEIENKIAGVMKSDSALFKKHN